MAKADPTNWKIVAANPQKMKYLMPLVKHYAKSPHPFTACVRDNRRRFGPRTEQVCAVVKDLIEKRTTWREGPKS
jgi:hypothetical protein